MIDTAWRNKDCVFITCLGHPANSLVSWKGHPPEWYAEHVQQKVIMLAAVAENGHGMINGIGYCAQASDGSWKFYIKALHGKR